MNITDEQMEKYSNAINMAITAIALDRVLPVQERRKVIETLSEIESKVSGSRRKMTNFEKIKQMDITEFMIFLDKCRYGCPCCVDNGNCSFLCEEKQIEWLEMEAEK